MANDLIFAFFILAALLSAGLGLHDGEARHVPVTRR
jgi:hypothetical protein